MKSTRRFICYALRSKCKFLPLVRQRNERKSFEFCGAIEFILSHYMSLPNVDIRSICSKFCVSYVLCCYVDITAKYFFPSFAWDWVYQCNHSSILGTRIHRLGEKVYQPLVILLYLRFAWYTVGRAHYKQTASGRYLSCYFYCQKFIPHEYISNKNAINFSPTICILIFKWPFRKKTKPIEWSPSARQLLFHRMLVLRVTQFCHLIEIIHILLVHLFDVF